MKTLEKSAGQGTHSMLVLPLHTKLKGSCIDTVKLAKLARLANTTPPLHSVESFIVALTASSDGEFSCIRATPQPNGLYRWSRNAQYGRRPSRDQVSAPQSCNLLPGGYRDRAFSHPRRRDDVSSTFPLAPRGASADTLERRCRTS